jgi:hypothetical protein
VRIADGSTDIAAIAGALAAAAGCGALALRGLRRRDRGLVGAGVGRAADRGIGGAVDVGNGLRSDCAQAPEVTGLGIGGKHGITADTALRLGQWFGTGPELWLNLQKAYELRLAEQSVGEEIRRTIHTRPIPQGIGGIAPI